MTTATLIDHAAIIARGYATEEEYALLSKADQMQKLNIGVVKDGHAQMVDVEGIWSVPLEECDVAGQRFHFVFFNDPLHFWGGPRPTAGLVGVATSHGKETRATAVVSECLELFKTRSGTEAIEYHRLCVAKHEAKNRVTKRVEDLAEKSKPAAKKKPSKKKATK